MRVANSNLPPILHRFRDIAFDGIQKSYIWLPLAFNTLNGGLPWGDFRKILPGSQQMANIPHGVETLPKISIAWVGRTNVTDRRQTTDGQTTAYSERERELRSLKLPVFTVD